jgi:Acyl-CoA dehydrogenase, C-terminal domain
VPRSASLSDDQVEARAFAESVAGVLDRQPPTTSAWVPGENATLLTPGLSALLDEVGWMTLAHDETLLACAGLGAVELGQRLAPFHEVDRLLGGSPIAGDLIRSLGPDRVALRRERGVVVRRPVEQAELVASAEGLEVHRVLVLGEALEIGPQAWRATARTWMAASVGYLAGLGQGALDLTVGYVRQRRAFGSTLAALPPVQQLLADAATKVRGAGLLAEEHPTEVALAYAGPAVAAACAACHQAVGAIGFTLEYPLQRYTQRARTLATWNDALLDCLLAPDCGQPSASTC